MIKFEEHEGKLFRMLEEPVPLTPEAEMPCLVRLIQDDSPMGKHNKDLHGFDSERLTPKICTEVIDVNDLSDPNRGSARCDGFMSIQYYRYELIGTPVAEDSAEWALYQMMQGNRIIHFSDAVSFALIDNKIVRTDNGISWGIEHWLRIFCSTTNWRIYEPEPQLTKKENTVTEFKEQDGELFRILDEPVPLTPNAKMPCLVRFRMPFLERFMGKHEEMAYFFYDAIKKNPLYGNKLYAYETRRVGCVAEPRELEIIGTFVEEGSADWAWHQMMSGKKIRHKSYSMPNTHCAMDEKCQIAIFTTPSSMIDGGDVICHANDWLTSRQIDTMVDERTGWQIYEELEPKYKVGDCRIEFVKQELHNLLDKL